MTGGAISIPLQINGSPASRLERHDGELENGIDNMLELIVFTPRGAFPADPDFGFEYWNHEFSNMDVHEFNNSYMDLGMERTGVSRISRKECESSLRESISRYEPRLHDPQVKVELDANLRPARRKVQSKYEMRILISGSIDDGLGVTRLYEKRFTFNVEPVARRI